jgi:ABC-type phosphate transport system substrate-binding protein
MGRRLVVLVVVFLLLASASRGEEESGRVAVIVHPTRQADLSRELLAQIYLRRKRFWDDGTPIVPLNLAAGAALRETFSRVVLRQSEPRLADYWNRQYFYGILPPPTLASTQAVLRYVAADPNALGYVPAGEVDASVRVVLSLPSPR